MVGPNSLTADIGTLIADSAQVNTASAEFFMGRKVPHPAIVKAELLREARGLPVSTLEKRAKLPRSRFHKWKGGTGDPTYEEVSRIASVLGVEPAELLSASPGVPSAQNPTGPGDWSHIIWWCGVKAISPETAFGWLEDRYRDEAADSAGAFVDHGPAPGAPPKAEPKARKTSG